MAGAKKSKKQRKHGRNVKSGQNLAYKAERRQEKSHVRRIVKHLARFANDRAAGVALNRYKIAAGIRLAA